MGPITSALIGMGGSFLSGIFGMSSKKKRQAAEEEALREANRVATENANRMNKEIRTRADRAAKVPIVTRSSSTPTITRANMSVMVKDAIKNGFNPLTVLRAGGLSGYSTTSGGAMTTSVTGSTMMDAALAGQHLPALSPIIAQHQAPGMGEVIGDAISAGTNTFLQSSAQQQQNQFQMALVGAQIQGSQAPGAYTGSRFAATPVATLQGSHVSGGNSGVLASRQLGGGANPFRLDDAGAKGGYQKPGDPMCWSGFCFDTDPGTSDAQSWESWLGEAADWLAAPVVIGGNLQALASRHGGGTAAARAAATLLSPGSMASQASESAWGRAARSWVADKTGWNTTGPKATGMGALYQEYLSW